MDNPPKTEPMHDKQHTIALMAATIYASGWVRNEGWSDRVCALEAYDLYVEVEKAIKKREEQKHASV